MAELSAQERKYFFRFRCAQAMQEIGILGLVFAPLDFLFDLRPIKLMWPEVAGAMAVALLLFVLGVATERRIHNAE